MDVQIFGTKKCRSTQKALRFFKERRAKIHFVDLTVKPAAPGELRRFEQKFGAERLLDRDSKRFRDRGLHAAHVPESRIPKLLAEDSALLATPLVRSGNRLSVGLAESDWRDWMAADD
jgi:arsenate reductase-like glutaredoxin family protein